MTTFKKIFLASFLLCLLSLYSCKKTDSETLLRDMAIFDFSYSKVILDTQKFEKELTLKSSASILNDWTMFKKKYYFFNNEDSQWRNDIDEINDILIRAKYYAEKDIDITASHYILHDVKYILAEMRERNNLIWFTDYISSIYKTTYRLNELAKIYTAKEIITEEDKIRITSVYFMLDGNLAKFIENIDSFDYSFFNFSDSEKNSILENIRYIDSLVRGMSSYVSSNDYKNIISATDNILTVYFDMLKIFSKKSGKI